MPHFDEPTSTSKLSFQMAALSSYIKELKAHFENTIDGANEEMQEKIKDLQQKIEDALIVTGGPKGISKIKNKIFSEYINVSNNVSNVRKFGSAALDMAYVACGRFDGYWQRELNYWDIAAGIILIKEAGGFVNFFEVDEINTVKKNIIASNSNIHEEFASLINKKDIE